MKAYRWGDNDRYFGPFTFARDGAYRHTGVILRGGVSTCTLRISGFGRTMIAVLPRIVKPWRVWVDTSRHDWSGPSGGYWDEGPREYGFTLSEGHLSVALGRVTNDSSTEQHWGCFLPWTQWRFVRSSFYGLDGALVWEQPKRRGFSMGAFVVEQAAKEAVPSATFAFDDFDGERLTATTRIEQMEWLFGEGWFKWLSLFRKRMIRRSLDIQFSGEVGERKGSWKGGTIGHSINMLPGELHEAAFRRYCDENRLTFIGPVVEPRP